MPLYYEQPLTISSPSDLHRSLPVGLLLCGATAVSAYSIEWPLDYVVATNVGLTDSLFKIQPPSVQSALHEIKTVSGLTWQQLARIFNVSPRSLHLWMDGETPDSIHEERLYRVLAIMRKLPFAETFQNRTFLLAPQSNGTIPLDLLAAEEDDKFSACVAGMPASPATHMTSSFNDRQPLPPAILLDATQDTVHVDLPGRRIVKAMKRKVSKG